MAKRTAKKKSAKKKTKTTRRGGNTRTLKPSRPGDPPRNVSGKAKTDFHPTKKQREQIIRGLGIGLQPEELRKLTINPHTKNPLAKETFYRHFRRELDEGRALTTQLVGESLLRRALDLKHPQGATCAIFYMKCRAGWREAREDQVMRLEGGVLVAPAALSAADWVASQEQQNEKRLQERQEQEARE